MKKILSLLVFSIFLTSCSTIDVITDYDQKVDFDQYETFAFYKPAIDKAKISDLDKKRILRAIEAELLDHGMVVSEDPDILIGIMTETQERINIYQNNFGLGWGWGWGWGMPTRTTSSSTIEGTLFIDVINAEERELVWQGLGTAPLALRNKKDERIKEIVSEIMKEYPPADEDEKKRNKKKEEK